MKRWYDPDLGMVFERDGLWLKGRTVERDPDGVLHPREAPEATFEVADVNEATKTVTFRGI